jgi:hypothetical protein
MLAIGGILVVGGRTRRSLSGPEDIGSVSK